MINDPYANNINLNNAFCLDDDSDDHSIDNNVQSNSLNYLTLFDDTYTPIDDFNNHSYDYGIFTTCNCCCN